MEKFLIIDGNSLAFRAYYALPFLTNLSKQPTGAIFGFMNMFLKVLEEYQPNYVVVAFDFSRKTFRNNIFAEYKGTRSETPDDLRAQFPVLKSLLKTMKIHVVEKEGFEADDIIGTYAKNTTLQKVILSGDRDLLQLIDENTEVWLTHKGISEIRKMTTDNLEENFGVKSSQIVDLKALMGDVSDNIPGINGIGQKTATNLISTFGSLENLYENLDNPLISPKMKEKLANGKDSAFLSQILATIKTDCDIDTNVDLCQISYPFCLESVEMIKNLDMASLLRRKVFFGEVEEEVAPVLALQLKTIETLAELEKICNCKPNEFAIALEDKLAFSFNQEFYYTVESEITLFSQPPEIEDCLNVLKKFLEDDTISKVVCNYKALKHKLQKFDVAIKGEVFDVNLANYLVGNKPLDCQQVGRFFAQKSILVQDLSKLDLEKIYYDMELPLEDVLFDMETNGFMVDKDALLEFGKKLDSELCSLTEDIVAMAGEDFNINSPKQLAVVLFDKLSLPVGEGNVSRSTSVEVLSDLVDSHPIVQKILKYRKVQKLKSTYVDAFLQILNQKNSCLIHTVFNQTLTATGRLSSSEPNLQNLPVRDDEGKELRRVFVSRFEDGMLVSADYNQIELRLLAHLSGDKTMISSFNSNQDIHTATAMQIFKLSEEEVTPQIRRNAKAVNFGIVYGISNVGLAENTGLSRAEAKQYIARYFEIYPEVKSYMDQNVEFAKKFGYVKTIFNRRRKIPELKSDNHQVRQFGERVAKNMPLQGSASDIIKLAMLEVAKAIKAHGLESKLILQVHDELVVDCPKHEVLTVRQILQSCMENVVSLSVKLPVDIQAGATYFDI